jgi:hypothetical protein
VKAEAEENQKRRKIEREVILVIALRVPQNRGKRRRLIEERNPPQARDLNQEVLHEKRKLKKSILNPTREELLNKKSRCLLVVPSIFSIFIYQTLFSLQ